MRVFVAEFARIQFRHRYQKRLNSCEFSYFGEEMRNLKTDASV